MDSAQRSCCRSRDRLAFLIPVVVALSAVNLFCGGGGGGGGSGGGGTSTGGGGAADTGAPVFAGATSALATNDTQILLSWNAATDVGTAAANIVYLIYQATISGGQDFANPTATSAAGATSHAVTGLTPATTYFFVVRARDGAGNIDTNAVEVSAATPALPDTTPPTFAGATGAMADSTTQITVSWGPATDNVTPPAAITYLIYQATVSGGHNFAVPAATLSGGAISRAMTGLTPATAYFFVVRARDGAGNTDTNAVEVSATTQAAGDNTPPVFAGATAATANSTTQITVSWNAATDDATAQNGILYLTYVSTASNGQNFAGSPAATSAAGATGQVLTNLVPEQYFIVVRARDQANNTETNTVQVVANTVLAPSPQVFTWGANFNGQVNGAAANPGNVAAPTAFFAALDSAIDIAAPTRFSVAVLADGTVRTWGRNTNGELGNGNSNDTAGLVQVIGVGGVGFLTGVTRVSAQGQSTTALRSDGTVVRWGQTPTIVLGIGGVGNLTGILDIATSEAHALALRNDGTVVGWGDNSAGTLGDNTTNDSANPVQVHGEGNVGFLQNVADVECGGHCSYAIQTDGRVMAWGSASFGVLGNNDGVNDQLVPVQVHGVGNVGFLTGVVAIEGGHFHTLALRADGTIVAWGLNAGGRLGNGNTTDSIVPVQVSGITDAVAVAGGETFSFAIRSDGTVWTWGGGTLTPVQVAGLSNAAAVHTGINSDHHIVR